MRVRLNKRTEKKLGNPLAGLTDSLDVGPENRDCTHQTPVKARYGSRRAISHFFFLFFAFYPLRRMMETGYTIVVMGEGSMKHRPPRTKRETVEFGRPLMEQANSSWIFGRPFYQFFFEATSSVCSVYVDVLKSAQHKFCTIRFFRKISVVSRSFCP